MQVLHELDLQVNVGQTIALVGSSGSGKSTVVDLVQRFYEVDSGEVCVCVCACACACVYVYVRVCACACVRACGGNYKTVCVCVCAAAHYVNCNTPVSIYCSVLITTG